MKHSSVDEQLALRTKGFLELEEGRRLYDIALMASRLGPCLEIGSYCGKSALFIGPACRQNNTVLFSVDHHRGSEEQQPGEAYFDPDLYDAKNDVIDTLGHFRVTLKTAGLENWVVPLVSASETAARAWATALGMVFIDGGHSQESVSQDYHQWAHHILPGGFLVMHDIYANPEDGGQGPFNVYQHVLHSGLFIDHPMTMSLAVLERKK